uniref:Uncharacterized protein n=1 Tax=Aegilops tauschii subsp. strangulata TaxID=200361 RepID=A0A453N2Z0_AEGTS
MPPAAHARIQPHCPPRVRARRVAALPGLLIPRVPWRLPADGEYDDDDDNPSLESEWPPASYPIHVFSSVTQRWDETTFLREGEAAGIVANMVSYPWYDECRYYGVYWQRTLYIQTKNCYLTRYQPPHRPSFSFKKCIPPWFTHVYINLHYPICLCLQNVFVGSHVQRN